jgi:hypothetical protein
VGNVTLRDCLNCGYEYDVWATGFEYAANNKNYVHVKGFKILTKEAQWKNFWKALLPTIKTIGFAILFSPEVRRHWEKFFWNKVKIDCYIEKENYVSGLRGLSLTFARGAIKIKVMESGLENYVDHQGQDFSKELRRDKELVLLALESFPDHVKFVDDLLKGDPQVIHR